MSLFVVVLSVFCISVLGGNKWINVELHDTGIDEINWKNHLQFYWNTPVLITEEDTVASLNEILKVLPSTDNRFGDLFNISDVLSLLSEYREQYVSFSEFISVYKKRIVSWMSLYTRGQCVIDADLNSLYLLVLSPGEVIPLHATFNFPVMNKDHESHDLISILSLKDPDESDEAEDGIFIYDPRGTASEYGFANTLIHTSQSAELNTKRGSLHIFPSGIKFNALPVDYTRVFLVSFAKLLSLNQPYRSNDIHQPERVSAIPIYHLQKSNDAPYLYANDAPFLDENVEFFSSFGTPIFKSKLSTFKSLSIPSIDMDLNRLEILSKCFIHYGSRAQSVRKSNRRNGWQSTGDIFDIYKETQWIIGDRIDENNECQSTIGVLYDYLIEQISLCLLSFSNSYYFDDNALIINANKNRIYVDIVDSWFNINRGIAMNVPHSHPNSDLSGVIYIDIPPKKGDFDGDIFFQDPRNNLFDNNMHLPFAQFNEPLQIAPQNGDTILFPSWLRHWTMPTYSSKPRVSFSFNVKFRTTDDKIKEKNTADAIQILKREL